MKFKINQNSKFFKKEKEIEIKNKDIRYLDFILTIIEVDKGYYFEFIIDADKDIIPEYGWDIIKISNTYKCIHECISMAICELNFFLKQFTSYGRPIVIFKNKEWSKFISCQSGEYDYDFYPHSSILVESTTTIMFSQIHFWLELEEEFDFSTEENIYQINFIFI